MPDDEDWLRVEDIYNLLGKQVQLDTIRSWIRTGKLPAYRPGRTYLVKRKDFEKFIKESRTRPNGEI